MQESFRRALTSAMSVNLVRWILCLRVNPRPRGLGDLEQAVSDHPHDYAGARGRF